MKTLAVEPDPLFVPQWFEKVRRERGIEEALGELARNARWSGEDRRLVAIRLFALNARSPNPVSLERVEEILLEAEAALKPGWIEER